MDYNKDDEKHLPHAIYKIVMRGFDEHRNCNVILSKLGISDFDRVADRVGYFIPYGPDGLNTLKYKNLEWETQFEMLFKVPTWYIADALETEMLEKTSKYIYGFHEDDLGIKRYKRSNGLLQKPTGYSEYRQFEASPILLKGMFELMLERNDIEILDVEEYNAHVLKERNKYKFSKSIEFKDL